MAAAAALRTLWSESAFSPALANVYIAAGHNMLGVSMAPATRKLIAELLDGRPPHLDAGPYAVGRF